MGNENNYYLVPGSKLNDIGEAIREKVETTTEYAVEEMPAAIREISTGVKLPDLTNPASNSHILKDKQAIDENGNILTGTIPTKTSSNLTSSGATVTVPAGYYATNASKSIPTATQATPKVSINTSTGVITASSTQMGGGYVAPGTKKATLQLSTQTVDKITPTKAVQTAVAKNVYTTSEIKVAAIPDEYVIPDGTITITTNGTYNVKALASAEVQITDDGPVLQTKTVDPKVSQQTVTPDSGYDGLSSVTVNAMPTVDRAYTEIDSYVSDDNQIIITASNNQGTGYVEGSNAWVETSVYLAVDGATVTASDGKSTIEASVSDENLVPENIKKDVEIFGVTGSYEVEGYTLTAIESAGADQQLGNGKYSLVINPDMLPMTVRLTCYSDYVITGVSFVGDITYEQPERTAFYNDYIDIVITDMKGPAEIHSDVIMLSQSNLSGEFIPIQLVGDISTINEGPFIEVTMDHTSFSAITVSSKPGYVITGIEDVHGSLSGSLNMSEGGQHWSNDLYVDSSTLKKGYPTLKITTAPAYGVIDRIIEGRYGDQYFSTKIVNTPINNYNASILYTTVEQGEFDAPYLTNGMCVLYGSSGTAVVEEIPVKFTLLGSYYRIKDSASYSINNYRISIDRFNEFIKGGKTYTLYVVDNATELSYQS